MAFKPFDAPIPGENYTSDTRNYPWHRPPEYTNTDEAINYISKTLMEKKASFAIISMLEVGMTVAQVVSTVLLKGVSMGKWSLDLALLLAGPLSHMIVIMAKTYEVEYDLGIEEDVTMLSKEFFKQLKKPVKITEEKQAEVSEQIAAEDLTGGGVFGQGMVEQPEGIM